ncbi:putative oxidoreductase, iron-sulfur binding protein [Haliangium ochraceum DSM 14365]|uniref:Putative oxidoreductase, iron-sulfur binding protein n=2 Tax=Haliangium ochraceum TaxID=80816 RepID=D0LN65_HALO1|nr:putative oxidoreductase, iron-sulfur binding protein [Haliangium ochraceum DSM 14365]
MADEAGDARTLLARREVLKLLGASMALAGVSGCNEPPRGKILPYAANPPELTPGQPVEYASSLVRDGFATGVLVQTREGRPIKVEGNPEHPASLGAAGVFEQAAVLSLYDPDRARAVRHRGQPSSWQAFHQAVSARPGQQRLRFLMPPQSSPLVAALIERIRARHPGAGFAFHAPVDRRPVYEGARRIFGRPLETQCDLGAAEVVLALDADFTAGMPNALRWAREFAAGRRPRGPELRMNRLYALETAPSPTGSLADHRLAVAPSRMPRLAAALLRLIAADAPADALPPALVRALVDAAPASDGSAGEAAWIAAVARDLVRHRGRCAVLVGPQQSATTHALAHLVNLALGNVGRTLRLSEPALIAPLGPGAAELCADMRAGRVDTLVIVDCNPVYSTPAALDFASALERVPTRVHLGLYADESAQRCHWQLPAAHPFESWGDARAYDGTASLVQPLIRPLYDGRSSIELLAAFAGEQAPDGHELVRGFWRQRLAADASSPASSDSIWHWERHLQRGFVADTQAASAAPTLAADAGSHALAALASATRAGADAAADTLELSLPPSPTVHDGRYSNNGWLLELPQPLTKLTWENAALLAPKTAARLGLRSGEMVRLTRGERALEVPALVVPGHADGAVTLHLGWGRQGAESLARGRGVSGYLLQATPAGAESGDAAGAPVLRVALRATGSERTLAITQHERSQHGRELALQLTRAQLAERPDFAAAHRGPQPTLLPAQERTGNQWAMTIDTTMCTGCSACMVACQAENNVPTVGPENVARGRQMHWIDIDTYFAGPSDNPETVHQPMLCQHCEHAPCEYACPVYATTHSPDGLNEMTYNRCIGTRFCSNNCPYKVRRFNWFEFQNRDSTLDLQHNPDVTVRERGVMEKCSYCVQRIRRAEIAAGMRDAELAPGAVRTACQQACPTAAIQFASLHHEDSEAVRWRQDARAYASLHELGARPRTMYLARVRNPNPEMD